MVEYTENTEYTLLKRSNSSDSDMSLCSKSENEKTNLVIIDTDSIADTASSSTNNMKQKTSARKVFVESVTTITHIVLVQFVLFILYLSFSHEVELFTWHPILLAVGWVLLMTEAILAISSENCITKCVSPRNRIFVHWTLQVTAAILSYTGFAIVFINKSNKSKEHFKTWHGTLGLVSVIFLCPTCILGFLTLFKVDLRKYISPMWSKALHIFLGVTTFVIGTVTLVLSVYSNWFVKRATYNAQVICFIMIVFASVWVLIRPTKFLTAKILKR